VKPSQLKSLLTTYATQVVNGHSVRPSFIWGPPGVGKSDIVAQVAEAQGMKLFDLRLLMMGLEDLRGLPYPDTERQIAKWFPPEFLPHKGDDPCILFIDELNAAPPIIQATAYQLVQHGRIGDYVVPPKTMRLAAGNRGGDRAVVHRMPSPLASRFGHWHLDVDADDWIDWAIGHNIRPEVVAFIKAPVSYTGMGHLLFHFDAERSGGAWPNPRTWVMVSETLNLALSKDLERLDIEGEVGEAAAAQFDSFRDLFYDLPDVDDILVRKKYDVTPTEPDRLYAFVAAVSQRTTLAQLNIAGEWATTLSVEFGTLALKMMKGKFHDKAAEVWAQDSKMLKWAKEHADVVF
jgi:hypothetical protein